MVKDGKPNIENQRSLNTPIQEVVKKKIIKWLDIRVVYPILDSNWVSPIQCIPKKRGLKVIQNGQKELISTTINMY